MCSDKVLNIDNPRLAQTFDNISQPRFRSRRLFLPKYLTRYLCHSQYEIRSPPMGLGVEVPSQRDPPSKCLLPEPLMSMNVRPTISRPFLSISCNTAGYFHASKVTFHANKTIFHCKGLVLLRLTITYLPSYWYCTLPPLFILQVLSPHCHFR